MLHGMNWNLECMCTNQNNLQVVENKLDQKQQNYIVNTKFNYM